MPQAGSPKNLDAAAHQRAGSRLDFIWSSKEWLNQQGIRVCTLGSAQSSGKVFALRAGFYRTRRTKGYAEEKALTCGKVQPLCPDPATWTRHRVRANTGTAVRPTQGLFAEESKECWGPAGCSSALSSILADSLLGPSVFRDHSLQKRENACELYYVQNDSKSPMCIWKFHRQMWGWLVRKLLGEFWLHSI